MLRRSCSACFLSWSVCVIFIVNRFTVFASHSYYSMLFSVSHSSAYVTPATRGQPSKMGKGRDLFVPLFVHTVLAGGARRFYSGLCLSSYPSSFRMTSSYSGGTTYLSSAPLPLSSLAWFSWWTLPTPGRRLVSLTGRIQTTRTSGNGFSSVRQPVCT